MNKITAIIIAKNEEKSIKDCIDSVRRLADEIIVVDNGSTDKTADVSKKLGAKAFSVNTDNFSELRNYGLEKARGDWVLYVDADERISSVLAEEIKLKIKNEKIKIYKIRRRNFYFGENPWPYIEKLGRVFKRTALKEWKGKLHESPIYDGEVGELKNYLVHYTHKNLSSMVEKTLEWSETEANLRILAKHPEMSWWRFPRVMLSSFFNSYIKQQGFRAGTMGLVESLYQAFSTFITYAKLWEMQQKIKKIK
ncbi:hypothetical protein A3F29_00315 [Candidatus Roizmanbacteria bacterium RIFCSPHIGHO2_12_FULL_33_9]|uniref:Glycosyltransferase 2-like domain-containing protein n=1 Tax=Candidatus Roizmanbacteria bacterium RIFCSPHIGHO2_12_FULL_33_9 TaxID=1802045 RepID=A0A1F7HH73_9BACT|nr:MAG: hypothetical protein A3F29_00315 [Candidatus Roizmanbacteria bacterium RIFCSPHIGHO2_12_FULL_33_9]